MWDPEKNLIDHEAFEGVDFIIHLAGANIGEKRWTIKRKEEIIKSRVNSTRFLHKTVVDNGIRLKALHFLLLPPVFMALKRQRKYLMKMIPLHQIFLVLYANSGKRLLIFFTTQGSVL